MGKNPVVAVIAAIVLVVAVIWIAKSVFNIGTTPTPGQTFWYDTGSNKLYGVAGNEEPPMPAPSGSEGVRAVVFAKGSCDKASDRYIGYLEKHDDPEAAKAAPTAMEKAQFMAKRDVRLEKGTTWVKADSDEGWEILEQYSPPNTPQRCMEYMK